MYWEYCLKMYKNLNEKLVFQKRNLDLAIFDLKHRKSSIQLLQKIDILDKNNNIIKTNKFKSAHSFTVGFLQVVGVIFDHAYNSTITTQNIIDGDNSSQSIYYSSASLALNNCLKSPAGTTTYGILAGTGTNAPTNSDYKMQTLIAHGTSANQLQYGGTSCGVGSVSGSNVDLLMQRTLNNGSGNSITVREIGMVLGVVNTSQALKYLMIARDAVNTAIANGSSAVVSYLLRTTV